MGAEFGVSGIVLAGGLSRRLGRDKAVEPFEGEPLIARVINRLSQVTDETVVVVNEPARVSQLPLPASARPAVDLYPGGGSLGGIFTGLSAANNPWALVVSCDMPFINPELLRKIVALRAGYDAVVPVLDGRSEPTHAAYSKVCLPHMERRLENDDLKIDRFFQEVQVRFMPQLDVDLIDPEHLSFFNVNTQQDLHTALSMAAAHG